MFVSDAHCDTLFSIGVDNLSPEKCAVTSERLREGHVGIQTLAMFAGAKGMSGEPYKKGVAMLNSLDRVGIDILRGKLPDNPPDSPCGVTSIEGGEILEGSLERLKEFDDISRIRLIALTWNNENEIGYPAKAGAKGKLKEFGIRLLKEMDNRGIFADVSHLNEDGFWDIIYNAELPPVASHSNCRWICPVFRNLRKEQVRAIIEKGGFIGVNFYTRFLTKRDKSTLEDVFKHIDAICEMGGEKVVGFGSDFDGIDMWPEGLANPSDFPKIIDVMFAHGYKEETVADISGLNYWRLLKRGEEFRKISEKA